MSLQIEHISYRTNGSLLLDDVTATANRGEIIGLIGPNGAGKSTLANVLDGFIVPSSGSARLEERNLIGASPQKVARLGIARMFQGQHLPWNSTPQQILISVLMLEQKWYRTPRIKDASLRHTSQDVKAQAERVLAKFGLSYSSSTPARNLSFGQQRLLALAMACTTSSRLLLLDEPFVGLKATILDRVLDILRAEAQEKIVVVIDHTLSAVRAVASSLWFMNRGRLTVFRDYAEMATSEVFSSTYLGVKVSSDQALAQPTSTVFTAVCRHAAAEPVVRLALQGVSVGYENKIIIRNVNLAVLPGEVVCVIGLNGSGKSTLLRAVVGLARLFEGHVHFSGRLVDDLPPDARVRSGMRILVQDNRLFRGLTLMDNLLLAGAAAEPLSSRGKMTFKASKPVLNAVAAKQRALHLDLDSAKRSARTYSGGEQARVALAQLDFGEPRLMLLDEPLSGIDGSALQTLHATIQDWRQRLLSTIIVEHNLDFVAAVATKVILVAGGVVTELPFRPGDAAVGLLQMLTDANEHQPNRTVREE